MSKTEMAKIHGIEEAFQFSEICKTTSHSLLRGFTTLCTLKWWRVGLMIHVRGWICGVKDDHWYIFKVLHWEEKQRESTVLLLLLLEEECKKFSWGGCLAAELQRFRAEVSKWKSALGCTFPLPAPNPWLHYRDSELLMHMDRYTQRRRTHHSENKTPNSTELQRNKTVDLAHKNKLWELTRQQLLLNKTHQTAFCFCKHQRQNSVPCQFVGMLLLPSQTKITFSWKPCL